MLVLVLGSATIATSGPGSGSGNGSAATGEDDEELGSAGSAVALVAPKDAGARKHWLVDHVAAAIGSRPAMSKSKIAIAITDVATGDELYTLNPDQNMNLASNAAARSGGKIRGLSVAELISTARTSRTWRSVSRAGPITWGAHRNE